MPMDRSKYPANWDEIARSIKERAGWRCAACGLEHDSYIVRDDVNPAKWRGAEDSDLIDESIRISHIVLTVHHIGVDKPDGAPGDPDDKMDNRPENLVSLCQRCHLLADQLHHMAKASTTRVRKKHEQRLEAGQGELF